MDDTAQPMAAETPLHEQIAGAADAIKAMRASVQTRSEDGRFAAEQPEETPVDPQDISEDLPDEGEPLDYDEQQEEADGPEEDQPEAVEMPKSWSKEDEELWRTLPPSAQARIAEREGQRDTAINSKFQEVANARKEYEARLAEANAGRDKWAQEYDLLVADLSIPKPDPRQYGLGSGNYNREAFDMAMFEWEQSSQQLNTLREQREQIRAQQERESQESWQVHKQQIEAEYAPKLLEMMPELTDREKAEPAMRALVDYAIANGLPPETFNEENQAYITAAQLALLAKARKFDELSKGVGKPAPTSKGPAIKPGVATPRAAQRQVKANKAMENLASTGSIDAAVAAMRARRR